MKKALILLATCFTMWGCDKGDPPLPAELQSLIVSAYPEIVTYAATSKITCLTTLLDNITITQDGKVLLSNTTKTLDFTTPPIKNTTTFQVTVGSGANVKSQTVTITVAPIDPMLKLLVDGTWQFVGMKVKGPSATEFHDVQSESNCPYDDTFQFNADKSFVIMYGTEHCSTSPEPDAHGTYDYTIAAGKMTLVWGQVHDVVFLDEHTLKLQATVPNFPSGTSETLKEYRKIVQP